MKTIVYLVTYFRVGLKHTYCITNFGTYALTKVNKFKLFTLQISNAHIEMQ